MSKLKIYKMKKLLFLFIAVISFSCSDDDTIDSIAENEADIQAYISENNLTTQKTASGLHYIIHSVGTGVSPTDNSNVTLAYKGYLLDGSVFDQSTRTSFSLSGLIPGFREGVKLLKRGGSGTFILPSNLGYGNQGSGPIAGGAVIIFDISLISIN